ncbi:diamine acetyltransferase 2-like [Contarinia nasturtii]|uniref:diamine acetyltransferase 2-like n=1 Tax=Contarinia nasturtii TaxID=265458 RepID=UPI0012D4ADA5|nr:diamine acetyltransferase 2-like [Contarinia nasturtii]
MPNGPKLSVNDLCRDGGFYDKNSNPLFSCFVAEELDSSSGLPQWIVGYASCFNTYSAWVGKVLFLEDLYVKPSYRKQGVEKLIFIEVAKYAIDSNCF